MRANDLPMVYRLLTFSMFDFSGLVTALQGWCKPVVPESPVFELAIRVEVFPFLQGSRASILR